MSCEIHQMCGTTCKGVEKLKKRIKKLTNERNVLRADNKLLANNAKPIIDAAIEDRDYFLNEAEKLRVALEEVASGYGRIGQRDTGTWEREHMMERAREALGWK
jgi:regulator of replication initiation timing